MRVFFSLFIICFLQTVVKADTIDHWMILINGQRVFECPGTCSANGLNLRMLKANATLKPGDKVTIVYEKEMVEKAITKNFIVSDSAAKNFQTFSVYDEDGTHAVTVKADDFTAMHGIVIWYSEKKKIDGKEYLSKPVPLVYFE